MDRGSDRRSRRQWTGAVQDSCERRRSRRDRRRGNAANPVWSRHGSLIAYGVDSAPAKRRSRGCDRTARPSICPSLRVRSGGYRFLPDSKGLVFQPSGQSPDFWLLDLAAKTTRRLTHLSDQGTDTDIRHRAGRDRNRVRLYPAQMEHRPDRSAESETRASLARVHLTRSCSIATLICPPSGGGARGHVDRADRVHRRHNRPLIATLSSPRRLSVWRFAGTTRPTNHTEIGSPASHVFQKERRVFGSRFCRRTIVHFSAGAGLGIVNALRFDPAGGRALGHSRCLGPARFGLLRDGRRMMTTNKSWNRSPLVASEIAWDLLAIGFGQSSEVANADQRAKAIQQKLDRFEDGFICQELIDLRTYQRQRNRLREELTLVEIDRMVRRSRSSTSRAS